MKKVLVVALSALLILALFIPALAADEPKFTTTVDKTTVKRGDKIAVSLVLDKKISTRNVAVLYNLDTSAFAYENKSGKWSTEIKMNGMDNMDNGGVFASAATETAATFATSPAMDVSASTIFTMNLIVKDDAPFGNYDLHMTVKADDAPAATVGATVTIAHDCVPATDYTTDAENHWKACTVTGCTVAPSKEAHKYDNACDTTCNTCNYVRTITHDFVTKYDAENHWKVCSVCGTEEAGSKAAHAGGEATCTAKAVCTVCNQAYGEMKAHTEAPESVQVKPADCANAAVHKKVCSVCGTQIGETFSVGTSDPSLHSGGTATCKDKAKCVHCNQPYGELAADKHTGNNKTTPAVPADCANTGWTEEVTCLDCGVIITPKTLVEKDPTKHTGEVEVTPEEPATCTKEGKTEQIACKGCGEILSASTPIAKNAHTIDTWTEVKPATVEEEGEKKGKCTVCETEFTIFTDKLIPSVAEENVLDGDGNKLEGAKVEGVGETKLPENTAAVIESVKPEELEAVEEEMKSAIANIPEAAGKDLLSATIVVIASNDTYVDGATGDEIVDVTANQKLAGKVKVTAPINVDATKYENLVFLAVDENGAVTKIDAKIENGNIIFETEAPLNAIMVLGAEKKAPVVTDPNVPQNGDSSEVILFTSMAIVSLLTLGAMFISKRAKASK